MMRILFVSNGYGETAIADRISSELRASSAQAQIEHLALVATPAVAAMHDVGPRKRMPSGGLIAMGNVRNIVLDLRAGLLRLTWRQIQFLRRARGAYDVVVAVGDAYALALALLVRRPTVFVGTAKSVAVAPYGPVEEMLLRRAAACFVRDEPTAQHLQRRGVNAVAANAIADLYALPAPIDASRAVRNFAPSIALFPGSRESAYADASFLLEVVAQIAPELARLGAVLSIAPGLDAARFSEQTKNHGWVVELVDDPAMPFVLRRDGREIVRAWSGPMQSLLPHVALVLGQAGTANEAAAAAGIPVVAFEQNGGAKERWYRRRQRGLLGDALMVVPASEPQAAQAVRSLLLDPTRRERMAQIGRARMGSPGAARRIAQRISSLATAS
jgi:uncharacterized protein (TIGR03492 family)